MRILTAGESWLGARGRGYNNALRSMGHEVGEANLDHFIPLWQRKWARVISRLILSIGVREFNDEILRQVQHRKYELFLAYKGTYVLPETLRTLRTMGLTLVNYYQDTSAFAHGPYIPRTLPEYDCVFYSAQFWAEDVSKKLRLSEAICLGHAYNEDLNRPWPLTPSDHAEYGVDVIVVGSHTRYKEKILGDLLRLRPKLNLQIWGNRWESCKDIDVLAKWQLGPLLGEAYSRALQAAKINLAITSGPVPGASQGDLTTGRTFEIPACGGFMLHERNPGVLELFTEGKEIVCFASAEELAAKIDYYLAHPEEREAIARAGHARCVPAYSDVSRLREIIEWCARRRGAAVR